MIDKSQTAVQVEDAFVTAVNEAGYYEAPITSPDVLVYAIGDCPTCDGIGKRAKPSDYYSDDPCPDCDGTGKERVRVIPEATLRRLVRGYLRWLDGTPGPDPLIAQLIEEL